MFNLKLKKSLILIFILLSHLFSVLTPVNASMRSLHAATKNEDLAPICNGTGQVRWIKLSDYYQTGKLNFIEFPTSTTDDKSQNNQIKCSFCSIFSSFDDDYIALSSPYSPLNTVLQNLYIFHSKQYLKQTFASANSRAPPELS